LGGPDLVGAALSVCAPLAARPDGPHLKLMTIRDFHAHIYFDPAELAAARNLAEQARRRFGVPVGHFHERPVGPHPRGSCQLTVSPERFGDFANWAVLNRGGLTIFAHANTGEDFADHTEHVIWFGPSEELDLSIFG
jgi:DOPA 4,5-dioxygenase